MPAFPPPHLLIIIPLIAGISLLLYYLLHTTEGIFLGKKVVIWLYDLTAHKYDKIKEFQDKDEWHLVTKPVLLALENSDPVPLILDVAAGTGRVPYALFQSADFAGYVVCLDASAKMLAQAEIKLGEYEGQYELVHHPAVPLPFPENSFDAVTCLEALEFFPDDKTALREMVRVLKPGGPLITTRRKGREGKAFLHRYRTQIALEEMLRQLGLEEVQTQAWQVSYDLILGRKGGNL